MITLTPEQLAYYNYKYFGDLGPQVVADMTATALAESDGRMVVGAQNTNGSYDRSAWQINDIHGYDQQRLLTDPDYAAQAARQIYDMQGIDAWAAWTSGNAYDRWDEAAGATQTVYSSESPESLGQLTNAGAQAYTGSTWRERFNEAMAAYPLSGGGSYGTQGDGASMVSQPIETLTGVELTQLAAYLANMYAQTRQSGLEGAGYADLGALGLPQGGYAPSLARTQLEQQYGLDLQRLGLSEQQFNASLNLDTQRFGLQQQQFEAGYGLDVQRLELQKQQLDAARLDAERQYGLDVQRFGLQYADTAYRQRLDAAVQQTNQLKTLASFQGPRDWLRYNYLENNMPAPVTPTVQGPAPQVQPTVTGQPPPFQMPGMQPRPPMPPFPQIPQFAAPQVTGQGVEGVQSAYYNPSTGETEEQARNPYGTYAEDWQPSTQGQVDLGGGQQTGAQTIQSPGMNEGQSYFWDPQGTGGIGVREADGSVRYLAFGGQSGPPMRDVHSAVVGDPQRRGTPNPELVTSRSPITATPLKGNKRAKKAAKGKPRMATGGVTGLPASAGQGGVSGQTGAEVASSPAITGAPFVTKVTQGSAPSFGARAEDLGPYGRAPLNYSSLLQLLPSEQEMMRGYIETPPELGGLGGWFPDEVERARRSSFQGLNLGGPQGYAAA